MLCIGTCEGAQIWYHRWSASTDLAHSKRHLDQACFGALPCPALSCHTVLQQLHVEHEKALLVILMLPFLWSAALTLHSKNAAW